MLTIRTCPPWCASTRRAYGEARGCWPPLNPPAGGGQQAALSPQGASWGGGGRSTRPPEIALVATQIERIHAEWSDEIVYDIEVEGVHSFLNDVCAVHNCGVAN